jgi:hypothetical protein
MIFRCLNLSWILLLVAGAVSAQTVSSQIAGTVIDSQNAAVPGASVRVLGVETNSLFETKTNERGEWLVPSLPVATYRVIVTMQGFQTSTVDNVKLEPGSPATVNVKLTVGSVSENVEVTAGADVLQTADSSVTVNLEGAQINELPMNARNATELIVLMPGTATPGTSRTSSVNGLQKSAIQMTLDGVTMQDPYLRSSDGFYAALQPKPEAIEEVAVTTAGGAADLLGQGAVQIRFVTKSGTNRVRGSLFWQMRNTDLDANYYFNNLNGLPRDKVILNQFGGSAGGPIVKDKLFFFVNEEVFRLPGSYDSPQLLVPTADAASGIYTYVDSAGTKHQINLYTLAAAANASLPAGTRAFATTPDPSMLATVQDELKLATPSTGSLTSRIASAGDYNRNYFIFQGTGVNNRNFPTVHLDWIAASKQHVDLVYNYQTYTANPDTVNGTNALLPGTGSVLGNSATGSSSRITYSVTGALRSAWTPHLTSETRYSLTAGLYNLWGEYNPGLFSMWNGYAPVMPGSYLMTPWNSGNATPGFVRRDSPVNTAASNFTYLRGSHTLTFGGSFRQISHYEQTSSTETIPEVTFGVATGDPINTGATAIFTAANFPGATATQRTEALDLYSLLTGRVASITRQVTLDEQTHQWSNQPAIDRTRERFVGSYLQDSWRATSRLTANVGLRWDVPLPFEDVDGLYSSSGYAGLWGTSGVGNLFQPGATGGSPTEFYPVKPGQTGYPVNYHQVLPTAGLAWSLPEGQGPLHFLTGKSGHSVLRAGYAISTTQDGSAVMRYIWGANPGRTLTTSVDPSNNPSVFGAPGSVWFRDPTLPVMSVNPTPTYPLPLTTSTSINEFDPHLRQPYVQSWSLGLQREVLKDTVLDVRYVGNHGVGLWRKESINEVNIFESGFLTQFLAAQQNLAIAQKITPTSDDFGDQGLAGQVAVPILTTALGTATDTTTATYLEQGQAGASANSIATNTTRMANLVKAGYPANLFVVNPGTNSPAYELTNGGASTYNALQVELRRRLTRGLLLQGSWVWAKALTNMPVSAEDDLSQPMTIRDTGLNKGPSPWDIRNSFKLNYIYDLPVGPGRHWLHSSRTMVKKALEGWQLAGTMWAHSGSPGLLRSTYQMVNANTGINASADSGVVLHNITPKQLQADVQVIQSPGGIVYFLPPSLLQNSEAAYQVGGFTTANLNPSAPYIGPPTTPGQFAERIYLYGPWQTRVDFALIKRTKLSERTTLEFRATALDALNSVNFLFASAANDVNTLSVNSSTFGQTASAYRDISASGANDPGGRIVEFMLRLSF